MHYEYTWYFCSQSKGKGKIHPMRSHEGPEGRNIYTCTLSLTSELDAGG